MDQSSDCVNELLIDDQLLNSNAATFSWGVGNQLIVAAGKMGMETTHHAVTSDPIFLHKMSWNKEMQHGITRKLLNESHQIFVEVQAAGDKLSNGAVSQPLLMKFSRKYRSVLRACVLELKSKMEESITEDESVVRQIELLKMMETLWNLFEILFIENSPAGVLLSRLSDWCKWHFHKADDLVEECVQAEKPHTHDLYWQAIKCLVLQGRTEDAQSMLELHPRCQRNKSNAFTSIHELLKKMPHFSYHHGQPVVEFEMKWNHWQEECRRRFEEGEFDVNEQLREVAMVLCGNEAVFENYEYGSWYQMLVSRLQYTQPTVSIAELHHHSKLEVEVFGGRERLGAFDNILLAAFELDPYLLLKECSQELSNWWLSAHLADLFHHSGLLSQKKLDFGVDFRELLLLEYTTGLMSHDSLWSISASYLSACSEGGNNHLSLFVQRVPLSSEKKVAKLLRICQNHGLVAETLSICRQMSISALRHNRLGTALMWCLRSSDSALTMHIAERMLGEYAHTGEFQSIDLLDYLGPSIVLSDRLAFLGKYRDFHKLLSDGLLKDAGNMLLSLFVSKLAPKEFWPSLLSDTLSVLSCEQLVYNASDSAKLLACLNSVDFTKMNVKQTPIEKEALEKRLELLRLALSRNLARAVISV